MVTMHQKPFNSVHILPPPGPFPSCKLKKKQRKKLFDWCSQYSTVQHWSTSTCCQILNPLVRAWVCQAPALDSGPRHNSQAASAALRTAELIEKQKKEFKTYQQQVLGNGIYKTEQMLFWDINRIFPILNIVATASVYMWAYKSPLCKEIRTEQS